ASRHENGSQPFVAEGEPGRRTWRVFRALRRFEGSRVRLCVHALANGTGGQEVGRRGKEQEAGADGRKTRTAYCLLLLPPAPASCLLDGFLRHPHNEFRLSIRVGDPIVLILSSQF